jgi:hypothetical protein
MLFRTKTVGGYYFIDAYGEYFMLKNCDRKQYVVAWKLCELEDGFYVWEQGYYFDCFHAACKCFMEKCCGA